MPGNDFEKQVQQKMDELSFVPSDAVWPEVEKQIARRKKRRVLFFWLPFLLLLLGGAAWVYIASVEAGINKKHVSDKNNTAAIAKNNTDASVSTSQDNKNDDRNKEMKPPAVLSDSTNNQYPVTNKIAVDNAEKEKRNRPAAGFKKDKNSTTERNDSRVEEPGLVVNQSNNKTKKNNKVIIGKEIKPAGKDLHQAGALAKNTGKKTGKEHAAQMDVTGEDAIAVAGKEAPEKENKKAVDAIAMEKPNPIAETPAADVVIKNSTVTITKPVANDSIKRIAKTDSAGSIAKNKKDEKKGKKKIEWGIDVRGGFTNISNGFSGVFSSSQTYDASAYLSNLNNSAPSAPNNNPGGAFNGSYAQPSDIKTGVSYAAGIFIRKPLGNNVSISAGLNYSYYSNRIDIGAKIDTNKALVQYKTGSASKYTNRFHFIEIPVTIEKQLGTKSRFSIHGGLAFSLLAGSNALLYDAQKNVYNGGKSQINKTQISLLAGARYRLFDKKFPVEIGPGFNYGLGNLFAKDVYGSRHLFFAGINARIFLSK